MMFHSPITLDAPLAVGRLFFEAARPQARSLLRALGLGWVAATVGDWREATEEASLATEPLEFVPLAAELGAVRDYLEGEHASFDHRLIIDIFCTPEAGEMRVPAGFLGPLAERAVDLGVSKSDERMMVTIFAREVGSALRIAFRSEMAAQGLDASAQDGAVRTLSALLAEIYGGWASLSIETVGHYSALTITIDDRLLDAPSH